MAEMANPPEQHIATGGDFRVPGAKVEPGTLAVLPALETGNVPPRLALARWIASRENPLTARVAVNRIWQEFFGRGIVRTSEDFGAQGEKPSHPELLDWLAAEFVDRGWSMKAMRPPDRDVGHVPAVVEVRKELEAKDPDNILLARQSRVRLSAELVRDAALTASGLLNPAIGGPSVRPPQPPAFPSWVTAAAEMGGEHRAPTAIAAASTFISSGPRRTRMLVNFDAPDSTALCPRRRRSNTPLQALNLLNDPVFFEAAQALAGANIS